MDMDNTGVKVSDTDASAPRLADANDAKKKKKQRLRKCGARGKPFEKGNRAGVRFGEGQPINMNGRPPLPPIKQAMKLYEDNALKAAEYLLKMAFDEYMDPKAQFHWFKELNSRILGAVKGSAQDVLAQLSEKLDGALSLSRPALEATAMGDAKGLIRELHKQGELEKVIDEVISEYSD